MYNFFMLGKLFTDKKRLFSAIAIIALVIPIFVLAEYGGEAGAYFALAGFTLIGMLALYELLTSMDVNKYLAILMSLSVLAFMMMDWDDTRHLATDNTDMTMRLRWALDDWKTYIVPLVLSFFPILIDRDFREKDENLAVKQIIITVVSILTGLFAKSLWAMSTDNIWTPVYFLLIAVLADTFAYLGGLQFGKKWFGGKKLAPKISPKKTWAGFVVGTTVTGIFAVLAGYFTGIWEDFGSDETWMAILLGIALTILAPFGDLAFSAIKRWKGIKDFSNLIPGHGGVFDRVDAMTLVVATAGIIFMLG